MRDNGIGNTEQKEQTTIQIITPNPTHTPTSDEHDKNTNGDDAIDTIKHNLIPLESDEIQPPIDDGDDMMGIIHNLITDIEPPYYVSLGSDRFDDILEIEIST